MHLLVGFPSSTEESRPVAMTLSPKTRPLTPSLTHPVTAERKNHVGFGAFRLGLQFRTRRAVSQLPELTWCTDVPESGNFPGLNEMGMGRGGHSLSEQADNNCASRRGVGRAPAELEKEMLDPVEAG